MRFSITASLLARTSSAPVPTLRPMREPSRLTAYSAFPTLIRCRAIGKGVQDGQSGRGKYWQIGGFNGESRAGKRVAPAEPDTSKLKVNVWPRRAPCGGGTGLNG